MQFEIRTRSTKYRMFISAIMPSLMKQLNIAKSNKFVLIEISKAAGNDNDGSTVALPTLDSYVITIAPGRMSDMGVTLAHEMVHVKQLIRGTLKTQAGVKYWRGKKFSKRVKYLSTPWEQEAFAKQDILFRRANDI
jgi:hypothetical protein